MKDLNETQKAALLYYVFTGETDRHIIYRIAEGYEKYNRLTDKSKNTAVSRWFNSPLIKDGINEITYLIEKRFDEIRQKAILKAQSVETETPKREQPKVQPNEDTNFLNLDEFLKYANSQANTIQDEKERRAWVEMIGKYMNFKESDEQEQQIKAYLPMICQDCELYKRCKGCKFDVCPVELV